VLLRLLTVLMVEPSLLEVLCVLTLLRLLEEVRTMPWVLAVERLLMVLAVEGRVLTLEAVEGRVAAVVLEEVPANPPPGSPPASPPASPPSSPLGMSSGGRRTPMGTASMSTLPLS